MKKEIELIPVADGNSNFTFEVDEELESYEIYTHDSTHVVHIDWSDDEDFPIFKNWLVETYGENVMKHSKFCIFGT